MTRQLQIACQTALGVLVTVTWLATGAISQETVRRPNVLFIAVDDLRPELNCYGKTHIHSPHIDALAASGVLFERSYCMVPTCGASRSSLMTGLRPSRNRFVNYLTRADKDAPGITTLNTHFKNNGYHTRSNGKVFHHRDDSEEGWSEPAWRPNAAPYRLESNRKLHARTGRRQKRLRGPAYESSDSGVEEYADGLTAAKAILDLRSLAKSNDPFFLAVGFMKPHLPFVAPKKFWDMYDPNDIHLPENYNVPKNAPKEAIHTSGELRAYHQIPPKGPVSDETARSLIHGYYACVSFIDAQIGRVLAELDDLGMADDTIVVLWGDHGWNLGDHTLWCKHSCFESSMHAPLIVRAPGIKGNTRTRGLTEFIDIYPTLCDLAQLEKPSHLQGRSFLPLLRNPDMPWKKAAIGRFQSGDTIRTDQHRFSQYSTKNGKTTARMLYDHKTDSLENANIAESPSGKQIAESLADDMKLALKHPLAAPGVTSLTNANVRYRVSNDHKVTLQRGDITAIVVDNAAIDRPDLPGHRSGYNGIASLTHRAQPTNLFVPTIAGLNFEHIHDGTTAGLKEKFEPRQFPMALRIIDQNTVEVYQPPTGNWKLESCGRYQLLSDGTIEYTFECIPRAGGYRQRYIGLFWASYIHRPEDKSIYFFGKPRGKDDPVQRIQGITPSHGVNSTHAPASYPDLVHVDDDFPLRLVNHPSQYICSQPWYYGVSHGMALVQMFRERDQIWIAQSPSGGGEGNPAWDFQWFIRDYQVGHAYGFQMRAAYLPFESHDQIVKATQSNRDALTK